MTTPITNRYDFVLLFDVTDGNPNGDPDAGNMPRIDPETGHGLVTDVALKRKIRDYVQIRHEDRVPNRIYVREGSVLQTQRQPAYKTLGIKNEPKKQPRDEVAKARTFMCENFYDVRAFGAVMSTDEFNAGQVRGPVQITFARSLNRILPMDHAITRVAYETEKKAQSTTANTEMGGKATVPYGLYRAHGFISPHLAGGAKGTGFSEDDLALLWEALERMFEFDRSAARGMMATRRLIAFKHDSELGNARSQDLFARVAVRSKDGVETPRAYDHFAVSVDEDGLPAGITVLNPA